MLPWKIITILKRISGFINYIYYIKIDKLKEQSLHITINLYFMKKCLYDASKFLVTNALSNVWRYVYISAHMISTCDIFISNYLFMSTIEVQRAYNDHFMSTIVSGRKYVKSSSTCLFCFYLTISSVS